MRKYFLARNMQAEFQSNEYGKLRRKEVSPVEPEDGLRLLYHHLELVALAVVQLGRQDDARPRTELSVHLIYDVFQNELFKVNISLGKRLDMNNEYYLLSICTWAIVTVSMEHSSPILRISTLMLRNLLSVIWA